jgi:hypothetical protein
MVVESSAYGSRHGLAKAHVIQFGANGSQTGFNIAHTLHDCFIKVARQEHNFYRAAVMLAIGGAIRMK